MQKRYGTLLACSGLLFTLSSPASAADDETLPHQEVIAAIQTAVAANPGRIKEVEVDRENGRLVVEVKIVGADGKTRDVSVDPRRNQVLK